MTTTTKKLTATRSNVLQHLVQIDGRDVGLIWKVRETRTEQTPWTAQLLDSTEFEDQTGRPHAGTTLGQIFGRDAKKQAIALIVAADADFRIEDRVFADRADRAAA